MIFIPSFHWQLFHIRSQGSLTRNKEIKLGGRMVAAVQVWRFLLSHDEE